jgi:hypothetical protein
VRRAVRVAALTAGVLAGVAGLAVGGARLGQDTLVYHPDRSSPGSASSMLDGGDLWL